MVRAGCGDHPQLGAGPQFGGRRRGGRYNLLDRGSGGGVETRLVRGLPSIGKQVAAVVEDIALDLGALKHVFRGARNWASSWRSKPRLRMRRSGRPWVRRAAAKGPIRAPSSHLNRSQWGRSDMYIFASRDEGNLAAFASGASSHHFVREIRRQPRHDGARPSPNEVSFL
jgi:hypothetical protein